MVQAVASADEAVPRLGIAQQGVCTQDVRMFDREGGCRYQPKLNQTQWGVGLSSGILKLLGLEPALSGLPPPTRLEQGRLGVLLILLSVCG